MFRLAGFVLGTLFAVAAALQIDDPDSGRWIAVYGAAAAISIADVVRGSRPSRWLVAVALLLGAVALIWAVGLLPAVVGQLRSAELMAPMDPARPAIELGRESVGLVIVAGWMFVVGGWRLVRERPVRG